MLMALVECRKGKERKETTGGREGVRTLPGMLNGCGD